MEILRLLRIVLYDRLAELKRQFPVMISTEKKLMLTDEKNRQFRAIYSRLPAKVQISLDVVTSDAQKTVLKASTDDFYSIPGQLLECRSPYRNFDTAVQSFEIIRAAVRSGFYPQNFRFIPVDLGKSSSTFRFDWEKTGPRKLLLLIRAIAESAGGMVPAREIRGSLRRTNPLEGNAPLWDILSRMHNLWDRMNLRQRALLNMRRADAPGVTEFRWVPEWELTAAFSDALTPPRPEFTFDDSGKIRPLGAVREPSQLQDAWIYMDAIEAAIKCLATPPPFKICNPEYDIRVIGITEPLELLADAQSALMAGQLHGFIAAKAQYQSLVTFLRKFPISYAARTAIAAIERSEYVTLLSIRNLFSALNTAPSVFSTDLFELYTQEPVQGRPDPEQKIVLKGNDALYFRLAANNANLRSVFLPVIEATDERVCLDISGMTRNDHKTLDGADDEDIIRNYLSVAIIPTWDSGDVYYHAKGSKKYIHHKHLNLMEFDAISAIVKGASVKYLSLLEPWITSILRGRSVVAADYYGRLFNSNLAIAPIKGFAS